MHMAEEDGNDEERASCWLLVTWVPIPMNSEHRDGQKS